MEKNTAQRIFTNTAGQIVLRTLDIIVGVITLGLITRYLGQEGFGYFTTVTAFLQLFIIIIDFGLYLTLLREISASSGDRTSFIVSNIFTLRLLSSIVFLTLASLTVFFTPYPREVQWGVLGLSVSFLSVSLISTLTALFQKHLQMVRIAIATWVSRLLFFILTIIIIGVHGSLQSLFYANSFAVAVSFFIVLYLVKKLPEDVHIRLTLNAKYILSVLSKTWPIALTTALNLIYFKADTIILSLFQNAESVGLYGASYRVVEIVTTFPHMFMGLVMPLLTAAWISHNRDKLEYLWEHIFIFFTFLTLPMIAGTLIVGKQVMTLIAGPSFEISGMILKLLIVASAAIFFGTLYTYMVLVIEKQRAMIKYFLATAILALIGYLILIPRFSYWGGAWVTVGSEMLIAISAAYVVKQSVRLPIPWIRVGKLLFSSIAMAIITNALQPYLPIIPLIAVSAVVYCIIAFSVKAFTVQDIRLLIRP